MDLGEKIFSLNCITQISNEKKTHKSKAVSLLNVESKTFTGLKFYKFLVTPDSVTTVTMFKNIHTCIHYHLNKIRQKTVIKLHL